MMIPIPPSQCVKARQKLIPRGSASICSAVRIDEPVVVKPELASKKASAKELIEPE